MARQASQYNGNFKCSGLMLRSLDGAPDKVHGDFFCDDNLLKSLEGGPSFVKATFNCGRNELTTLKGAPARIEEHFFCHSNKLKTLEGAPAHVVMNFDCDRNALVSLEGCPPHIGQDLNCNHNRLTSLKDIHKIIKKIGGGRASFEDNPIKSHVLGLLKIEGLYHVDLDRGELDSILNKHLDGDRNILACQEELMDAGLGEFAQL